MDPPFTLARRDPDLWRPREPTRHTEPLAVRLEAGPLHLELDPLSRHAMHPSPIPIESWDQLLQ
jgi:hypothetical protein